LIDRDSLESFRAAGFLVLRNFYDLETEIDPVKEGVRRIVELVAGKYGVGAPTDSADEAMRVAYPMIIAKNRAWGGEVYDAIKQIPAFVALVGCKRNTELFEALRPGSLAGVAAGGYGIRIDNPGEAKFRAWWHQEFPAQLRSLDGLVFWSPLLEVTPEMGPVGICAGSHKEGLVPVFDDDAGLGRAGAYALRMQNEVELVARYPRVAPLTKPGDLIVMDFLAIHESGQNVAAWPRWTMQLRYFNFKDPLGQRIAWKGSFLAGENFGEIVPELVGKAPGEPG
jgi:hypothetical protein